MICKSFSDFALRGTLLLVVSFWFAVCYVRLKIIAAIDRSLTVVGLEKLKPTLSDLALMIVTFIGIVFFFLATVIGSWVIVRFLYEAIF